MFNVSARYSTYGLTFDSDIALPELRPAPDAEGAPDVRIVLGPVAPGGLDEGTRLGPFMWASDRAFWLQVPGVARFLVEDGRRITLEPAPGIDEDSVRVFLLGSAMGALMFQRGLLVMHGNAVRIGERCLLCVGQSGAGKSTLAASFMRRGYDVLADDVVPVDAEGRAVPGFPRIKLWQDAATQLGFDTAPLRRIRPGMEKFNLPIAERHSDRPLPIRWVYLLNRDSEDGIHMEPVRGMKRFPVMRRNTYRVRYLDGMALRAEHLKLCARLSSQIHLSQLHWDRKGADPDAMIDAILRDIEDNG